MEPRDPSDPPASELSAHGRLLFTCLEADDDRLAVLEQLCREHPDDAAALRQLYHALAEYGFDAEPADEDAMPERIGPYRVLDVLGSGGMGLVYLAEQESLGRQVALKLIHGTLPPTPRARERFRREIQAVSLLDHPNICPVYDAGEIDGVPYLAMRYVRGETLEQQFERARATRERTGRSTAPTDRGAIDELLELVERLARALHAAHERGLVHRDVKPGNVMVESETGEPLLLDFGLARLDDGETPTLTRSGDRVGTPAYMAPEQVAGRAVDRRTDVYALGVLLYEGFTLRPPYQAPTPEALYRRILAGQATRASRFNAEVPRDLEIVLETALDPDADRRYGTAAEFADDLRRVLQRQPIVARPLPWALRARRWVQRHPVAAAVGAVLVVALAGALILLQQRSAALDSAQAVELALRANQLSEGAPARGLELALAAVEVERNVETRSALYAAVVHSHERVQLVHGDAAWRALFSADGDQVLTYSDDETARLWDRHGSQTALLPHDGFCSWAEFSPDGSQLVTSSLYGAHATIWNRDGEELHVLRHGPRWDNRGSPIYDREAGHWVWMARFSPDGLRVATTCTDRLVRVWDARTGGQLGPEFSHEGPVTCVTWSSDGLLASGEDYGESVPDRDRFDVFVWRPGKQQHEVVAHFEVGDSVPWLDFSPDGSLLLGACFDGNAYVWSLVEKRKLLTLQHDGRVHRAYFSPDGHRILTASQDGSVRLWTRTGQPIATARHGGPVTEAIFVDGGARVLSSSWDTTTRLFDDQLNEQLVLRGHRERVFAARLSPDGRQIATASWDGTARLWDLVDRDVPRLLGHTSSVRGLAQLPDGRLASVGDDATLRLWQVETGKAQVFPIAKGPLGLAVAPDGKQVLVPHEDSVGRLYDVASGQLRARLPHGPGAVRMAAAFLGDGRVLTTGDRPRVWSPEGQPAAELQPATRRRLVLASAPRRGLVAAGGWDKQITIWNETGELVTEWPAHDGWVRSLAWSPDERLLASGSIDQTIKLWERVASGQTAVHVLDEHDGKVLALAWSDDGTVLASGSSDGTVRLWTVPTGDLIAVLRGHRDGVNAVQFLADGRLASGGDDGAIQVWPKSVDALIAIARDRVRR